MPTIEEIRAKFPQYGDMSDAALADALHDKYYKDMPRDQFNQKIGLTAPQAGGFAGTAQRFGQGALDVVVGQAGLGARMAEPGAEMGAALVPGGMERFAAERAGRVSSVEKFQKEREAATEASRPPEERGSFDLPRTAGRVTAMAADPLNYIGPGSLAFKVASAIASGTGSELAGQAAEGSGFEGVARVLGGAIGGLAAGSLESVRTEAQLAKQLPTLAQHKAEGDAAYEQMRQMDVRLSPQARDDLDNHIDVTLDQKGKTDVTAAQTYALLGRFNDKTKTGTAVTVNEIDQLRQRLGDVSIDNASDHAAASMAIDALDNWLQNVDPRHVIAGDPNAAAALIRHGQGEWATFRKLEDLEKSRTTGEHRAAVAGVGANQINTQRQEIRKILDSEERSRGFSDEAKEAMTKVIMGTWLGNKMRQASKFAPTGPVSALTTLGAFVSGGIEPAAVVAGVGFGSKKIGEYLTERQIRALENIVNREAPITKPMAAAHKAAEQESRALPAASALRGGAAGLVGELAPE